MAWGRSEGFTLIELLVSLTIFGMLSAAGVLLLSFSVRAQEGATERLDELAEIRRAGALLTSDLAQAAPRLARDEAGASQPAFAGSAGQGLLLSLVRRGWENLDGASRSSLQKVQYRQVGDRIERVAYAHVDGAPPLPPAIILDDVRRVTLRYRDRRGEWRDRWDPQQPFLLPAAVEMVVDTETSGQVRQLFLVGNAG
jgi:general secretion pathway protein J